MLFDLSSSNRLSISESNLASSLATSLGSSSSIEDWVFVLLLSEGASSVVDLSLLISLDSSVASFVMAVRGITGVAGVDLYHVIEIVLLVREEEHFAKAF